MILYIKTDNSATIRTYALFFFVCLTSTTPPCFDVFLSPRYVECVLSSRYVDMFCLPGMSMCFGLHISAIGYLVLGTSIQQI